MKRIFGIVIFMEKNKKMTGTKHKSQKVAVFVDVQNMYYSGMSLFNKKVNFENVLKNALSDRELIRAFAYTIEADMDGEKGFHGALERIGYEVKTKGLQTFSSGAKKGDWDVGIAMDVVRMIPKLDVVILISGDGDFSDMLNYAKSMGCRAEVMSFRKTTSSKLIAEADDFIDLSADTRSYLIDDRSRTNSSHNNNHVNNRDGTYKPHRRQNNSNQNRPNHQRHEHRKPAEAKFVAPEKILEDALVKQKQADLDKKKTPSKPKPKPKANLEAKSEVKKEEKTSFKSKIASAVKKVTSTKKVKPAAKIKKTVKGDN